MLRIVLGIVAAFIDWLILWVGSEKLLSAIWPGFGAHQRAFQQAIENKSEFKANAKYLSAHIVLAPAVSLLAGLLAALIAAENTYAPLILGGLLSAMAILKAAMSWRLVPVWYHILFTAELMPLAYLGGQLWAIA